MRAGLLSLLATLFCTNTLHAQAGAEARPFSTLDVGLYAALNVNRNDFHDYWDDGTAGAIDFVTPFYAGRASLLIRIAAHDEVDASSGFTSVFAALGWRVGRQLHRNFRADVGLHAGLVNWIFDEESESSVKYELEFASEAGLRADIEFAERWHAIVEGSYQITFTHERIELAYVSFGFAHTFGAPHWIRSVLQ